MNYFRDGNALVVIGSNVGDDRDPQWWQNLKAHPEAEARTTRRIPVILLES